MLVAYNAALQFVRKLSGLIPIKSLYNLEIGHRCGSFYQFFVIGLYVFSSDGPKRINKKISLKEICQMSRKSSKVYF